MAKNLRLTDTVTISSGGTVSTSLQLQGNRVPLAIVLPSAFTGTSVTFQASIDDSTYNSVYDEGSQYSVNVGTSRFVSLKRQPFEGVRYVKIVSSATGPSYETASRSVYLVNGEY